MTGTYEYDVVFSFAGENRDYVERVAEVLRREGVNVFYDRYNEVDMWGKDLYTHLDDVYRRRGKYCVMFISDAYRSKLWTNHERESAQARAFQESREYILPVRFDDTEIPGLRPTTNYLSADDHTPEQLAEKILEKLGKLSTISPQSGAGLRAPNLVPQDFNPYEELLTFVEELQSQLKARTESLAGMGIRFTVFERSSRRCFRFVLRGEAVYSLDVWLGDSFSDKSLSFMGAEGELRPLDSGSNAMAEIIWSRDRSQPVLRLTDFSLLGLTSVEQVQYAYTEFVDALWDRICDAIESSES